MRETLHLAFYNAIRVNNRNLLNLGKKKKWNSIRNNWTVITERGRQTEPL